MLPDAPDIVRRLRAFQREVRQTLIASRRVAGLHEVSHASAADTIYRIDTEVEPLLESLCNHWAKEHPIVLVAEGLQDEDGHEVDARVFPRGAKPEDAPLRLIVDPIDGTRGLMYQKRPAWILTGAAAGPGPHTLADIEVAVQTEIPLVKQHLCDELWAVRSQGAAAQRVDRLTGRSAPLELQPSTSATIAHGFATIARFFPGNRGELGAIDDELVAALLGPPQPGKAQAFEDQYISTGGQFYELVAGHDRFVADLRALVEQRRPGGAALCCHPYDLCTELIARELGVVVTDEHGQPLRAPLDVSADVNWVGYANETLRTQVEPHLQRLLKARGLL